MIPASLLARHLRLTKGVSKSVRREIEILWGQLALADLRGDYRKLEAGLAAIIEIHGEIAAVAAADFYDELARLSGRNLEPAIAAASALPKDRLSSLLDWGLSPLWEEDGPREQAALGRLQGGAIRAALAPGRQTIARASERDGVKWAVVPQGGDTCAYCLMLASRGAVYSPEWDVKYHDFCQCAMTPVFDKKDLPAVNQELRDEWDEATRGHRDQLGAWKEHIAATRGIFE